jgi:hypothetical protein
MEFEDLALDELRALLRGASWQKLLVAIARCPPIREPRSAVVTEYLRHCGVTPVWQQQPVFDPAQLPALDRSMTERYIAVLLQHELAYGCDRLARAAAEAAARLFLEPFGASADFYASVGIDADVLDAKERNLPCGYVVYTGIFGSTLEQGVFAVDRDGCIGLLFVGDED